MNWEWFKRVGRELPSRQDRSGKGYKGRKGKAYANSLYNFDAMANEVRTNSWRTELTSPFLPT